MLDLTPPRHTSTLPKLAVRDDRSRAIQKALLFQTYVGPSIWRHRMGAKSQRRSVEAWLRGTAEGVEQSSQTCGAGRASLKLQTCASRRDHETRADRLDSR